MFSRKYDIDEDHLIQLSLIGTLDFVFNMNNISLISSSSKNSKKAC